MQNNITAISTEVTNIVPNIKQLQTGKQFNSVEEKQTLNNIQVHLNFSDTILKTIAKNLNLPFQNFFTGYDVSYYIDINTKLLLISLSPSIK